MSLLLDNSIALAWCFESEQTAEVMALLDRVSEHGAVAPQLWPIEALNGLLVAERRQRIDRATARKFGAFLQSLPIVIDDQTADRVWTVTAELASHHGLTAYDAAYLELARRLALPLATKDRALRAAAKDAAMPLLPAG
jgi:predicted nucleic acid-binding protein